MTWSEVGGRYGSGITEEEYRRASEKKLPQFIYFKDEQTIRAESLAPEEEKQEKLVAWKEELRKTHALGTAPFTSPDDLAARVTADLSNWLLDQWGPQLYLNGVGALPYDYAGRIENFLSEYLGTTTTPVPFGGREKDLKALDAWLDNATAPPYLLMAAPAGRGKSALLVRWTRQLLARPNICLVFIPISIRFRTNLSGVTFAALAARLATLHGETIPNTPSTSVEVWRGLVTDYLRRPLPNGERLVVVLDGLDEAADWEAGPDLFPLTPLDHVRIVVSARYRAGDADAKDWLRRLGWEQPSLAQPYDLDILTREGVARVLESMGFPLAQLGAQVDIVAELYLLTEGDPLLVKLYVEDLWSHKERVATLKPEDLGTLKPGLEGYFDRWWDDQRKLWGKDSPLKEQNVQTVLNVLACSLGPSTQDDVLHLTRQVGLTSWGLEEALRPLDRFVIGDGKVHGYVLSHPRLGDYFEERLSASEQQVWQQQFLDWGKETIQTLEQGTLAPTKAPAYIVQYYGAHLEQAHASAETLLTLVCQGWSKAWEALEGSFAGFLNDVERAWKAAERENEQAIAKGDVAPRIGDEIRCALVRASITSLAANLPVELIVQLVKYKKWTFQQGITYARLITHTGRKSGTLLRLAMVLTMPPELRTQTMAEALALAETMKDSTARWDILAELAPHLPEAVLTNARTIEDSKNRAELLTALIPHLAEADHAVVLQEALAAAHTISDGSDRAEALTALLPYLTESDRTPVLQESLTAAASIPSDNYGSVYDRAAALTILAPYLPEAVLIAARTIVDNTLRAHVLACLLPHLTESDRTHVLQEALMTATTIGAPHIPKALLTVMRTVADNRGQANILAARLSPLTESDRATFLHEALLTARTTADSKNRAKLLTALIPHMAEADRPVVLQEAVTAARTILNNPRAVLV